MEKNGKSWKAEPILDDKLLGKFTQKLRRINFWRVSANERGEAAEKIIKIFTKISEKWGK